MLYLEKRVAFSVRKRDKSALDPDTIALIESELAGELSRWRNTVSTVAEDAVENAVSDTEETATTRWFAEL